MLMIIDIRNPNSPSINIPTADTFVIISNSFLVGFLSTNQTLLHFIKKDFALPICSLKFITMNYLKIKEFLKFRDSVLNRVKNLGNLPTIKKFKFHLR